MNYKAILIGLAGTIVSYFASEATEKGLWALDNKLSKKGTEEEVEEETEKE